MIDNKHSLCQQLQIILASGREGEDISEKISELCETENLQPESLVLTLHSLADDLFALDSVTSDDARMKIFLGAQLLEKYIDLPKLDTTLAVYNKISCSRAQLWKRRMRRASAVTTLVIPIGFLAWLVSTGGYLFGIATDVWLMGLLSVFILVLIWEDMIFPYFWKKVQRNDCIEEDRTYTLLKQRVYDGIRFIEDVLVHRNTPRST